LISDRELPIGIAALYAKIKTAIGNRKSAINKGLLSLNRGGNMPHHKQEFAGFFLNLHN